MKANQTVTISTYKHNEAFLDDIKSDCEDILSESAAYKIDGDVLYGDMNEFVYVFSADADLELAVAALKAHFEARVTDVNDVLCINDVEVNISWHKESNVSYLANGYVCRAILAGIVFAILAFVYVSLRFKRWDMGLLLALAIVLGAGFTTALIALVRIPVTASTLYAVAISGLLTAITVLMSMHRVRLASKDESSKGKSAYEVLASSIAWKEIVALCSIVAITVLFAGILVGKAGIWFAISALIGVLVSAFIGLFYAPAAYAPLKSAIDAKLAEKTIRYRGAEKTSTKVKKSAKQDAPVEETTEETVEETEAPAEETVEETETPAEETVEETETPAEEIVEETETPAEEIVEETVEEENND